jgi:hypothetical protein
VQVRSDTGEIVWEDTTPSATTRWTESAGLAPGRRYRVYLTVQPEDLLAPGAVSVEFRTGDRTQELAHRIKRPDPRATLGGVTGLVLMLIGGLGECRRGWGAFRRRRR